MDLDVAFVHPPSVVCSAPLSKVISFYFKYLHKPPPPTQYLIMPMGIFSMASFLEDNGFSARVFNLGLEQILRGTKDLKKLLTEIEAKIYAIDLHWFVHSDGAIETARTLKTLYPNSKVVLGGITASFFKEEILLNHSFIDAIVVGEGERSILDLTKAMLSNKPIEEVKGIAFKEGSKVLMTSPQKPLDINTLDFTRLNLMYHYEEYLKVSISNYIPNKRPSFWLTLFRGCPFSCIYCGGSRDTYTSIFHYSKIPIIRETEKVVDDIKYLEGRGVKIIRFGQDPEVLGSKYYDKLFGAIRKEKIDVFAYNEAWNRFPSSEFLTSFKNAFSNVNVAISPDSSLDSIRQFAGRSGTNEQLLRLSEFLDKKEILGDVYFLIGLPGETKESCKLICRLADKLSNTNYIWIAPTFPFTLDPNSQIALNPSKYGVKLYFKSFKDYKNAFISPDPIDWIAHETKEMTRQDIIEMTNYCASYISSLAWPALEKKKSFELL
ncbi:MAG: radical SAM protein [Thermoproteota archaeon]